MQEGGGRWWGGGCILRRRTDYVGRAAGCYSRREKVGGSESAGDVGRAAGCSHRVRRYTDDSGVGMGGG